MIGSNKGEKRSLQPKIGNRGSTYFTPVINTIKKLPEIFLRTYHLLQHLNGL